MLKPLQSALIPILLITSLSLHAQMTTAAPATQAQQITDNPELRAIFIADQRDRGNDPFAQKGDPQPVPLPDTDVRKNDDERDLKVKRMLKDGDVRTGADFYRAALVYQHSGTPEGFLLAHVLATIAVSKGTQGGALWLSASSLDRYLTMIGKKQIFGTQFHSVPKAGKPGSYDFVQSDIEPDVVSDVLRAQLCVLPLAAQSKGLPGPPQGTSLYPCPAADDMRARSSANSH